MCWPGHSYIYLICSVLQEIQGSLVLHNNFKRNREREDKRSKGRKGLSVQNRSVKKGVPRGIEQRKKKVAAVRRGLAAAKKTELASLASIYRIKGKKERLAPLVPVWNCNWLHFQDWLRQRTPVKLKKVTLGPFS